MKYYALLIVSVLLFSFSADHPEENQAILYLNEMTLALDQLKTFKGEMKSKERIDGVFMHYHNQMTVAFHPKRVYIKAFNDDGSLGPEVLYREGENDNRVLVNTHGFPFININLSPTSSLLRNNRHNTILEAGGVYLSKVLKSTVNFVPVEKRDQVFSYHGEVTHRGRKCHKIIVDNPDFGYITYQAKEGETIRSIAFSRSISEYKIIESNPELDDYDSSVEDEEITIPNSFSRKNIIYIDVENGMPLYLENYDDKGLYSVYDYIWLKVNSELPSDAFDPDNPNYGFN